MTNQDILAFCRLDGLTADQLAGIDVLGQMTDGEVTAFAEAFDAAWEANRQGVTDAKSAIRAAIDNVREVEERVAAAARERDPLRPVLTQAERGACDEALTAYQAALDLHDVAKAIFKAGVTHQQLEERL